MVDCHLLKEVYINLIDQKTPKLNLDSVEIISLKFDDNNNKKNKTSKKIINPSNDELRLHKKYLKFDLPKNYYN